MVKNIIDLFCKAYKISMDNTYADKVKEIKHPKAQSNFKAESLIQLLSKTASLIKKCEDEEYRAFLEYENRMRKAEIDRLIEEGYIDPDTLKSEVVM